MLVASLALAHAAQPDQIYPLSEGTTWTYAGRAKWTVDNSTEVRGGRLRWTAEVVKTFSGPGVTTAVIKGFPFDLAWYDPQKEPNYTVVVENSNGLFESDVETESDAEALAANAIQGRKIGGDQLVKFPVRVGDCLGDDSTAPELLANHMYCWFVKRTVMESGARGWEITEDTGPADLTFLLVSGIGITHFNYNHHGTVAITDARLIAFHHPKKR
jgi:hypothetical protein